MVHEDYLFSQLCHDVQLVASPHASAQTGGRTIGRQSAGGDYGILLGCSASFLGRSLFGPMNRQGGIRARSLVIGLRPQAVCS